MIKIIKYFVILLIIFITAFTIVAPIYVPLSILTIFFMSKKELFNIFYNIFLISGLFVVVFNGLDLLFGFTAKRYLKNRINLKDDEEYTKIKEIFFKLKKKFKSLTTKLVVVYSDEINAYAITGIGRKYLVLTTGLISHLKASYEDENLYLKALEGIMAHEFSHLVHNDSIPEIIQNSINKLLNISSTLLKVVFDFLKIPFYAIPILSIIGVSLDLTYQLLNLISVLSHRFIINPLFDLINKFLSRKVEYRCDREAAYATGDGIYYGLSALPDSGYNSILSTHPPLKDRIGRIEDIKPKNIKLKFLGLDYFIVLVFAFSGLWLLLLFVANTFHKNVPLLYKFIHEINIFISKKLIVLNSYIPTIFDIIFKSLKIRNTYFFNISDYIVLLLFFLFLYFLINFVVLFFKMVIFNNKNLDTNNE